MNLVVRKLSMLKNSIEEKELLSERLGNKLCSSDIKLKNNVYKILEKMTNL